MKEYDLIVVGAGAAGLLCGAEAARLGLRTALVDHAKRPAMKLAITGKGRCNLTNDCSPEEFIPRVRTNPRFLYSAIHAFPPAWTMEFFRSRGVPLKTERGGRVFPQSDQAAQIVDALLEEGRRQGVEQIQDHVSQLLVEDGRAAGVRGREGEYRAHRVVLCTGGMSYPGTGSDGSGYAIARKAGHRIVEPRPSLIPIVTRESWCGQVAGLSLRNVTLTLWQEGKKKPVYRELGEMLFTHFGVSGPLVLTASSYMRGWEGYRLTIDLKPGLDPQKLDARLLRDFDSQQNKHFANSLGELLPRSLIPVVVELSGIGGETKVHQVTREERQRLVALLKALPLTPAGFRPVAEAIVTAGGVDVAQVNPKTMESKLVPGLYFAGEVLDVDGTTGGYNLQIAFSTGMTAARSAAAGVDHS